MYLLFIFISPYNIYVDVKFIVLFVFVFFILKCHIV